MKPCTEVRHRRFPDLQGITLPNHDNVQLAPGQVLVEYEGNTVGLSAFVVDLIVIAELEPKPSPWKCGRGLQEGCCVYLQGSDAVGYQCARYSPERSVARQRGILAMKRVPMEPYPACQIYQGLDEPDMGGLIDERA